MRRSTSGVNSSEQPVADEQKPKLSIILVSMVSLLVNILVNINKVLYG